MSFENDAYAYFGRENVATTYEVSQAEIYASAIPFIACDPSVRSLLFFHLIDDSSDLFFT